MSTHARLVNTCTVNIYSKLDLESADLNPYWVDFTTALGFEGHSTPTSTFSKRFHFNFFLI